jgi:very-short-patch-repair endonuclease
MGQERLQPWSGQVWELAGRQHGVVARSQLLALGMNEDAIQHRVERGRLHRLWRGVYAVGRSETSERGRWIGAVLRCGPDALLSHRSAAALWGMRLRQPAQTEVVVPGDVLRRVPGILVHRRAGLDSASRRVVDGIPLTDSVTTLVDLATCLSRDRLEFAVNEADRLDLIDPEALLEAIGAQRSRPGCGALRKLLERQAFRRTDSGLERKFLSLVRATGLPLPDTQAIVNGFRVDFYWPQFGLVVEVDGLRYHRTTGEQTTDLRRDQVHSAAGLTSLRFSEGQVRDEPSRVQATLAAVARRLEAR